MTNTPNTSPVDDRETAVGVHQTLREKVARHLVAEVPCYDSEESDWRAFLEVADAAIAIVRAEVEAEVVEWLLKDGTRLDYEQQPENDREHPLWWAADAIDRHEHRRDGE